MMSKKQRADYQRGYYHKKQQEFKDTKEKVRLLERELRNIRLNTNIECPLCVKFPKRGNTLRPAKISGWMMLTGKSITHYFKCDRCETEWK